MLQVDFLYAGKGSKNDFSTNSNIPMTLSYLVCIQLFQVVGKSHATIPKGARWFWVHCSSGKFERMAWEAMNLHVCLPMLKESNKSRFDSFGVRDSALIISHIAFRDCCEQIFWYNLSRNSVYKWHFPGSCFKFNSISISSRSNCWI